MFEARRMQDTGQILATTEARTWPSPQMAWKLGHLFGTFEV